MREYPRRGFLALLTASLAGLVRTRTANAARPKPAVASNSATPRKQVRRYRADATVLLLGMPVFHRSGVGGGQASLEESSEGEAAIRTLFFAAGSDPDRAHGLSRVGWIREVVREANSIPVEARYFGVLTASNEENLEHAKKAVATPEPVSGAYNAVSGRNTPGGSRSATTHFELSAAAAWWDRRLIEAAEAAFQVNPEWRETAWPAAGSQAPPTFLFELTRLLRERAPRATGRYVYNEQEYRLELSMPQAGKPPAGGLMPAHGKIRNLRTGSQNTFTLWLEDTPGSIMPVRIEYQPRSFLRLVFEAA